MPVKYTYTATKAGQSVSAANIRALNLEIWDAFSFPVISDTLDFNSYQRRLSRVGIDVTREYVPPKLKPPSDKGLPKWASPYRKLR